MDKVYPSAAKALDGLLVDGMTIAAPAPLGVLFATPLAVVGYILVKVIYVEGVLGDRGSPPQGAAQDDGVHAVEDEVGGDGCAEHPEAGDRPADQQYEAQKPRA